MSDPHGVLARIDEAGEYLAAHAEEADELGRLPDETAARMREIGIIRLGQPREFGGYEAHPADFYEAVMRLGLYSPPAAWVAGVVGIHPYEIATGERKLQEEIWGDDPDTWTCSPYAPMGTARKADGGYVLSGKWSFSTGTNHSNWAILGAMVVGEDGKPSNPPDVRHFIIPRADWTIVEDSWQVIGLKGSGSKDIVVSDAFVPEYRIHDHMQVVQGVLARKNQPGNPVYGLSWGMLFGGAIAAAAIGIADGAVNEALNYTRNRVLSRSGRATSNPHQMVAVGEATADIEASKVHFLDDIRRCYDTFVAKGSLTEIERLQSRRTQVRAAQRAVEAADQLFKQAGGTALQLGLPQQRFWRDSHAGLAHLCNVAEPVYETYGRAFFGEPVTPVEAIY
ncbi:MAG: hydroxylase [Streptosporangiales bacterium]|jgi:alkylation response protein AidB-like acyl-CoA dehydrogenase|nr:hydroxylase [Streptosporangiales bacterium]